MHMVNEEMDSTMESYQNELNLISDAITDVNHRLERLYDAIETGKLNLDDLVVRIRELRSRQDQLQARRIELEEKTLLRKGLCSFFIGCGGTEVIDVVAACIRVTEEPFVG